MWRVWSRRADFGRAHNEITAMSDDEETSSGVEDLSPDDADDDDDPAVLAVCRATADNLPMGGAGEWQAE